MERKNYLKKIKRAVIKIGSSSLTDKQGGLDAASMKKFTDEVSEQVKNGVEIIIVTSGAISAGLKYLDIYQRPTVISTLQASAAVGQVELMRKYGDLFAAHNIKIGQILLTREDTTRRKQYLNIRNTITDLLRLKVLPVINENDSVAVEEIKFGDNDRLAALVSSIIESDILIILSDIDGMYDKNPKDNKNPNLISFVDKINPELEKIAGGIGSAHGSGGMLSKVKAAKICAFSGIPMVIANSEAPDVIKRIIDFEPIGTFFAPNMDKKVKSLKRWIAFGMQAKGSIYLDDGAAEAIKARGKSILPVGVIKSEGSFKKGDTLKVYTAGGAMIAKGITSLSCEELNKVRGKNIKEITKGADPEKCTEVIHRDSLVIFDDNDFEV